MVVTNSGDYLRTLNETRTALRDARLMIAECVDYAAQSAEGQYLRHMRASLTAVEYALDQTIETVSRRKQ